MAKTRFNSIDEYIATFPEDVQALLGKVRQTIQDVVPDDAEEVISYQMPTFKLNRNLIHFAGFDNHIGSTRHPPPLRPSRKRFHPINPPKAPSSFRSTNQSPSTSSGK